LHSSARVPAQPERRESAAGATCIHYPGPARVSSTTGPAAAERLGLVQIPSQARSAFQVIHCPPARRPRLRLATSTQYRGVTRCPLPATKYGLSKSDESDSEFKLAARGSLCVTRTRRTASGNPLLPATRVRGGHYPPSQLRVGPSSGPAARRARAGPGPAWACHHPCPSRS
jgi:hypothetical protein